MVVNSNDVFKLFQSTKGAVSIRMNLYGVSFCFVGCHFTAHEKYYRERIEV